MATSRAELRVVPRDTAVSTTPLAVGLEQAAAMIGVAARTLRKWSAERRLRSVKLGGRLLFRLSDLEKFLQENIR